MTASALPSSAHIVIAIEIEQAVNYNGNHTLNSSVFLIFLLPKYPCVYFPKMLERQLVFEFQINHFCKPKYQDDVVVTPITPCIGRARKHLLLSLS